MDKLVVPEVYEINDHLLCFYLGRDVTGPSPVAHIEGNWVDKDWEWGVCSYVVHCGEDALVLDTNVYPDQALWIRHYMEEQRGVRNFMVSLSHWHLDHIAGNEHFADVPIIATSRCRAEMCTVKGKAETGTLWKEPAIKVVLPNVTYEDQLTVYVGDIEVQLYRFNIHTPDSACAYLPSDKCLLCSDMLEDTCAFVLDVGDLAAQQQELLRLKTIDATTYFPCHGDPQKISHGGYGQDFIDAVLEYQTNLVAFHDRADYATLPLEAFIPDALAAGTLSVWEPYLSVHQGNVKLVQEYFANKTA